MSETPAGDNANPNPNGEGEEGSAPSLSIVAQYIKDLSFENPLAPNRAPDQEGGPNIEIQVNVNGRKLSDDDSEVAMQFRVEAKTGDQTAFIVELVYAAVFKIQGVPPESMKPVLLIEAPRLIFPFARRILSDVTRDGGFPPLLLEPINFAALYQQNLAAEQAAADKPESPDA